MALAFLFGVAFGWVMWGVRSAEEADEAGRREPVADDPAKEVIIIRAELEAARRFLEETDGEDGDISEQLSKLDETVKRANGRLKMVSAAIKRAASRD